MSAATDCDILYKFLRKFFTESIYTDFIYTEDPISTDSFIHISQTAADFSYWETLKQRASHGEPGLQTKEVTHWRNGRRTIIFGV